MVLQILTYTHVQHHFSMLHIWPIKWAQIKSFETNITQFNKVLFYICCVHDDVGNIYMYIIWWLLLILTYTC